MEIKKALVLDSGDSLSKAVSELMETGTAVVVTKNKKYYGIVDDRHLRHGITDPVKTKVETVVAKSPTVPPDSSILDRINAFLVGHFKALPVVDDSGKVLGITTRVEVLTEMLNNRLIPKARVSEFMNSPVYSVEDNESLGKVKGRMKELNTNKLLVTNKGNVVGVISTLDLAAYLRKPKGRDKKPLVLKEIGNPDETPVSKFLRSDVITADEKATLEEAIKKMVAREVSSVVITSDRKPVGVFSALDLFKKIKENEKENTEIQISGLNGENKRFHELISDKITGVADKFSKSFNIRNVQVKIKENKKTFVVHVYLETDEGRISMSHERYGIKEAVDEISGELDRTLRKMKDKRKNKKRKTHRRS